MGLNKILFVTVFAGGIACLLLSLVQPWWLLPMGIADSSTFELTPHLLAAQPWIVPFYQCGSIVVALACLILPIVRRRWQRAGVTLASFWAALLLFFPYWTIVGDASLAGQAAWLQSQHENLTWLGGDLATSFEYNSHPDKARVYVVDTPRRLSIVPMPTWSLLELSPSHFQELLQWLGYNNTFCQFYRRGWILACAGTVCVGLFACVARGRMRSRYVSLGLRVFGGTIVVGCVYAWVAPFSSSRHLAYAADLTSHGHYTEAAEQLRQAAAVFPAIAEDTYFLAQLGLLEVQTGNLNTPAAQLYLANRRERAGRTEQAQVGYQALVAKLPNTHAVRREACRALLRSAVYAFNSSANEKSAAELRNVLAVEPCNLKAIYVLMLASLRSHDRVELERLAMLQYEIYSYCQFSNKKVVLADAQRQRLMAAINEHDITAAMKIRPKLRKP